MSLETHIRKAQQGSDLKVTLKAKAPDDAPEMVEVLLSRRRPWSLHLRSLFAATVALCAFIGISGFALERAFYESSERQLRDRLRSYVWAYLSSSDVSVSGKLILPEYPPEPRFQRPRSGLYAGVTGQDIKWESVSALGRTLPFDVQLPPNEERFSGPIETNVGRVFVYSLGVDYIYGSQGEGLKLSFHVAEHESTLLRQLEVFRQTLWSWMIGLGVALLAVQVVVLRWGLRPLRRVADELAQIEQGEGQKLLGRYPRELEALTENLNDFIESEREQRERYRNTMADLAHSLKTPLAVLRSQIENGNDLTALRLVVGEQVSRMSDIVAYQLSRGSASGVQPFAAPIQLDANAEQIVRTLEKVYAEKSILCEFEIDPDARFYGEIGDLMELLGNLLENAFKWAKSRVLLTVTHTGPIGARRGGMDLIVEDDGPGIADDKIDHVLQRGVRGDERVQGHGIGLSIVENIVLAQHGELLVDRSPTLSGARFIVKIPAQINSLRRRM
jgi:two-component system sensor histidine kinase PhoQ